MQDFTKLKVWEKSHQLALSVYKASQHFPKEELYGLASQLRRAAASIPANIAEGCGRAGNPEFAHFLNISHGSASELLYHLILARDLGYLTPVEYETLNQGAVEVKQMLVALIKKVKGVA
jgi:four helix bundle protein